MAALAADIHTQFLSGTSVTGEFSNNTATEYYYRGAVVFIDTGGGCQVVPAAGDLPLGLSPKKQYASAAGVMVEVVTEGWVWLPVGTGVAADDEGTRLILDISATQSDNVVDWIPEADAGGGIAANDISLGFIKRATATQMLIKICPAIYTTAWVLC